MVYPTLDFESQLWAMGYTNVAGVDEVGRGCFAGPVVSAAVVFPPNSKIPEGIADSKLLAPAKREYLAEKIKEEAVWSIGEVEVEVINQIGIGKATQQSFVKAVKSLSSEPDFILIDAFYIQALSKEKQKAVRDGDKVCLSIAAASIIAKVYRDKLMVELANRYPGYGFASNKGYGTKTHREALKSFGLSGIHRTSFNLAKFL